MLTGQPALRVLTESTHTLAGCYAGAVVDEKRRENRAEHLETLLGLVSAPQLDAQQGEDGSGGRLLLPAAWKGRRRVKFAVGSGSGLVTCGGTAGDAPHLF